MDEDFLLAIRLQEQFDQEYRKRRVELERPLSIVDESWEMLDPSPDIRAMFLEFNDMFFWGKLSGVEVKWSSRMTLCAGVCSYEGQGGLCSIRLSEPLLKLRPRKDLVQTLLHEMIHALLFVTQNNRDRDGHGPEFCKHMNRINKASGTKITIYHSFHDEVDMYRQHWWRCNGPCQKRKPYFGYVKRAMNRAPSSLDPWWEDHQRTCGGTYTKIKEPEGYGKKGQKNSKTSEKKDIRDIIPFSGKGFILGGKSQDSTSSSPSPRPPLPVVKTPLSNPVPSPEKFFTPSSPPKSLSSPVHSNKTNGISNTFTSVRPSTSMGRKPPVKRSVGNTTHFVNINGSPVKMPKSQSSSSSQGGDKSKQSSIDDLFNSTSLRKSETKRDSLTSPKSSTNAASASSRFQKQQNNHLTSSPSTPSPSPNITNHSKVSSVVTTGSQGLHSVASSSSSSSSSFAVMVSCPVCQAKVQESKINEHLDSCLS
uniref:DNA-dependent metalloprotease SPRTN n=1 Tax=Oreochromis aureus TaxID=47969 RepID=A0A668RXX4_OREAU